MRKRSITSLAAITAVIAFAVYGTYAAWTATTSNTGSSIETGDIAITDDDSGQAMFDVSGLEPGDSLERCIRVTNAGSTDFDSVELSAGPATGDLAGYLDATIDRGTGSTTFPSCTGFTVADAGVFDDTFDEFLSNASPITEIGTPAAGWTAGSSKVYRITLELPSDTPNASAGQSTTFSLVWDAEVN